MGVPTLYRPPPSPAVLPPVIVSPEIDAVTLGSTWNTRLARSPLIVTPAARARDRLGPGRVAQLELGAGQV